MSERKGVVPMGGLPRGKRAQLPGPTLSVPWARPTVRVCWDPPPTPRLQWPLFGWRSQTLSLPQTGGASGKPNIAKLPIAAALTGF